MDTQITNTERGEKTLAGKRIKEQGAVWEIAGSRKTGSTDLLRFEGTAKGQQVTLKRILEEQAQLQDFGTGLSGQTNASLVPVSISTSAVCCMDGIFPEAQGR